MTDRESGRFKGSGFLDFATPADAQKATTLHDTELLERKMIVQLAKPKAAGERGARGARGARGGADRGARPPSQKPEGCDTCFIGNLNFSITDDDVHEVFGSCGTIISVRWVERDGKFSGIGFVQFADTEATDKAVALSGTDIKGRPVRVDFAQSKSKPQY